MTPTIINLGKRFGLVAPDITKARKRKPDSGMDWRAYNAANPTETQKDSRGRWTDNPVGRAIAQAYANVRARPHTSSMPRSVQYRGGEDEVAVRDIREEMYMQGHRFPREVEDAEFRRLSTGGDSGEDPMFLSYPITFPSHWEQAQMTGVQAGGFSMGNQQHAFVQLIDTKPLPEPSKPGSRADAFKMDPGPLDPSTKPWKAARARLAGQLDDSVPELDDWDADELTAARDAAKRFASAADAALKGKKAAARKPSIEVGTRVEATLSGDEIAQGFVVSRTGSSAKVRWDNSGRVELVRLNDPMLRFDAKKPRATARVTAKPERDFDAMAAEMRALPLLPESEGAAKRMLEPLNIPELKAFAGVADVPISSKMRKQELRDAIYNQMFGSRVVADSVMNYDDPHRYTRRRAMDALHRAGARDGTTMGIEELRAAMGGTRAEQDAALMQLSRERQINLMPQSNQKVLTDERRAAALRMGNEDKTLVMLGSQAGPARTPEAPAPKADAAAVRADTRADEVNRLTAQIMRTTDKAELKRLNARRAELAGEVMHGTPTKVTAKPRTPRAKVDTVPLRDREEVLYADAIYERADRLKKLPPTSEGIAQAKTEVAGLSNADLKDLAAALGQPAIHSTRTKKQLQDHVVGVAVGNRAKWDAIAGRPSETLWGKVDAAQERARNRAGGDQAASLRHQEAMLEDMRAELESMYGEDPDRWPEARQDQQVEAYWNQRDRVERMRRNEEKNVSQSATQPPEMTRAEILQAYSDLARRGGDLVPLTRLRAKLPHVSHDDLTAVLKQMDRERIIHLDPDSNRKALPPEAHAAAVVIGGEDKHFISTRR